MEIFDGAAMKNLQDNIEVHMDNYKNEQKPWVGYYIEGLNEDILKQSSTLLVSSDSSLDTKNAIRLYEENKNLSTTLASNNSYWTTLAHTKFYAYMQSRWKVKEEVTKRNIEERYFYRSDNQKSRARHGIARLWWIANLTYDKYNENDPYYYARLATRDQELFNLIIETKHVAQNRVALHAMLDVVTEVYENEIYGRIPNKRNYYRDIMKQINLIGSVSIWDLLNKEEGKDKLFDFSKNYLNSKVTTI